MQTIFEVLFFILDIVWVIVIIHAVMSWLVGFNVVSLRQPFVGQIWYSLEQLLQPIYSKIRQFLPRTGPIDFAPLILIVGIYFLQVFLRNNFPGY